MRNALRAVGILLFVCAGSGLQASAASNGINEIALATREQVRQAAQLKQQNVLTPHQLAVIAKAHGQYIASCARHHGKTRVIDCINSGGDLPAPVVDPVPPPAVDPVPPPADAPAPPPADDPVPPPAGDSVPPPVGDPVPPPPPGFSDGSEDNMGTLSLMSIESASSVGGQISLSPTVLQSASSAQRQAHRSAAQIRGSVLLARQSSLQARESARSAKQSARDASAQARTVAALAREQAHEAAQQAKEIAKQAKEAARKNKK
ncbi:MAG: hypothetical protein WC881_04370 [Elusimicrobiota bacterium]